MVADAPLKNLKMISVVISDFPIEIQYTGFNRSSYDILHGSEAAWLS